MVPPVTLLAELEHERLQRRDAARREMRERLESALAELLPRQVVFVFGSITMPGRFHARSDIDLGVYDLPAHMSEYRLQSEIERRVGCPVDLLVLPETRLYEKIRGEGELWIV